MLSAARGTSRPGRADELGALDGIRVIDMTTYVQGPATTLELADMGADVIKVEPLTGDHLRGFGGGRKAGWGGFEALNRSKRSLALDLRKPEVGEILGALLAEADVLVVNQRQSLLKRLGIDFESLSARHPRLIHAAATGFGVEGPLADEPAFDIVAGGRSGYLVATGRAEGEPRRPLAPMGDLLTAKDTVIGIVMALFARERTGRGQRVVTSLLSTQVAFQRMGITQYLNGGGLVGVGHRDGMALSTWYRTRDGGWIVISLLHPRFFPMLCKAIGRPDLAEDPRFGDARRLGESDQPLRAALAAEFAKRDRDEWAEILREAEVPAGPVYDVPEVVEDEQVRSQKLLVEYAHPEGDTLRGVGFASQLGETPASGFRPAPEIGEHSREILAQAGFGEERIQEWVDAGVVGAA